MRAHIQHPHCNTLEWVARPQVAHNSSLGPWYTSTHTKKCGVVQGGPIAYNHDNSAHTVQATQPQWSHSWATPLRLCTHPPSKPSRRAWMRRRVHACSHERCTHTSKCTPSTDRQRANPCVPKHTNMRADMRTHPHAIMGECKGITCGHPIMMCGTRSCC